MGFGENSSGWPDENRRRSHFIVPSGPDGAQSAAPRQGTLNLFFHLVPHFFMNPEILPIADPVKPPVDVTPVKAPSRVAHWRWWVATILIGSSPLLASLMGGARRSTEGPMLPKTVLGLLIFCAIQMAAFGVVWGIAWLFARPNRDELRMRLHNIWKAIGWGVIYSVGMRLAIALIAIYALVVLSLLGFDAKELTKLAQQSGEGAQKAFAPAMANTSLVYKFLMISLVSFVVAGLREELWRTFTLTGLQKICPQNWSVTQKNGVALVVSSVFFGLGHVYQGVTGVVLTTFLGLVLGGVVLRHKSIWPAVIAHGCFDAVSFIALALVLKK
jgi:membrane protease YdiL (CAAX protease family)